MFDKVDPRSWKQNFVIFLMRKERAHIGFQPMPVLALLPNNTLVARTLVWRKDIHDWWIAQDKGISYGMIACEDDPDADTVAKTYFASKVEADPPEPALLTELVAALETRFLGDQQVRIEALLGQYNAFAVESSTEKAPAAIDRFKLIVQKLTQLGSAPTEGSKIEKIKSALKCQKRFETLNIILHMMPAGTTFDMLCDAAKSYDRAIMELPNHSVNSLSTGKKQFTPAEKLAYHKLKAKEKQQKFKQQKDKHSHKPKRETIDCHNCGRLGHYSRECPHAQQEEQDESQFKGRKKRTQYERAPNSPRIKYERPPKKPRPSIQKLRTNSNKALDWSNGGVMDSDEAKDGYESNMISQGAADSDDDDEPPPLVQDDSSDDDDDEPRPKRRHQDRPTQGNFPSRSSYIQFPLYIEPPLVRNTRIYNAAAIQPGATVDRRRDWEFTGPDPDDSKPDGDSQQSSEDMSSSGDDEVQSIFMTSAAASISAKETIFLDSCASRGLLIVNNSNILDDMDSIVGVINLTKKGSSMATQGTGSKGSWQGITVCEDSVKNICAVDRLKTAGYGLVQLEEDHIVDLQTRESVLKCKHKNGMPYVLLADLLSLPDISC